MRAPLCSDATDLCPDDQGLIVSENESQSEIHAIEKSLEKSHTSKTSVFGICLDNLMGTTPQVAPQIPFILSRLCRYIEEHGLQQKHLFLEGEEKDLVESLKIEFIESGDAPLETVGNVASVAKLLIIFFEDLPEPLIPVSAQPDFVNDMESLSLSSSDCVSKLKQNVSKLPESAYHVLKYLSRFLLRVACNKKYNGMSCDDLGILFGPLLFRPSSKDPLVLIRVKNVVNYLVRDYHAIFEDDTKTVLLDETRSLKASCVISDKKHRKQLPCPSSVMPVMSLCPLSVVIPSVESDLPIADDGNRIKDNVPVLLIESQVDVMDKSNDEKSSASNPSGSKEAVGALVTRKRKERRPSGEDSLQRSSSEERPSPGSLVSLEKIELLRRCSSHEEMIDALKTNNTELDVLYPKKVLERDIPLNIDSYLSGSLELVVSEKNHSPHPPNAKRREVEINKSDLELTVLPWNVSDNSSSSGSEKSQCSEKVIHYGSMQNSFAELTDVNTMDFDVAGQENEDENEDSDRNTEADEFQESRKARIPRSASCPVPGADSEGTSESENNSLSLSWSMLFESEDSEPVRSEHHSSWPMMKDAQDDDALLSPSVQSLRKSNFYEAPLSPSAYRSYLSYRSTHLDPSVPPSPPVEQEDFAKNLIESNAVSDSIKQLTKKIHSIKKRVRKFDEKFEAEFGYKPSHAEKANNSEAKKLMNDLYKARKELKALKEESHLEHVSSASSWHATRCSHILGDTTNHFQKATSKGAKPSVEDSYGVTIKSLADDRKTANRPENVEAMTTDQVKDEKLAIQKALLYFESIHGKPAAKDERNTIRPLYDRYRNIKRLLVRSGSFPGAVSKNKDLCSELQPILEHETMDFTSPQNRSLTEEHVEKTESHENSDIRKGEEKSREIIIKDDFRKGTSSSQFLASKYENSNVHELPLSEMIFQLQQVKSEKRHLRKILREFESEFFKLNGRKVQKEDKLPVDTLYGEYKHIKARLKLLEALISKHDQHQLM